MRFKRTVASRRWTPLAASLAMFALLCATIAYWALQLLSPAVPIAPAGSLADQRDAPDLVAAGRLFGMPVGGRGAAQVAVASNIQVLGVAASEVRGSAVLAVDGKPPKAYMVGDAVGADAKLVEVRSDAAIIERNGARVELAAPQRPSVATLTSGPARTDASPAAVASPVPTAPPVPPPSVAAPPPPQPGPGPINGRSPGLPATTPAPAQLEATGAPATEQPDAPAQQPAAVADQPGPVSR